MWGQQGPPMFMLRSENLVGFSCHPWGPRSYAGCQPAKSTFTSWPNLLSLSHTFRECFAFPACLLLLPPCPLSCPGTVRAAQRPWTIAGLACWSWVLLVNRLKRGVLVIKLYTHCLAYIFFFLLISVCLCFHLLHLGIKGFCHSTLLLCVAWAGKLHNICLGKGDPLEGNLL